MGDNELRAAMRPSGWRVGAISFHWSHIAGAALAVAVVGAPTLWMADLVSRDVSGVPVVLALNGVVPPAPSDVRIAELPAPEADTPEQVPEQVAELDAAGVDEAMETATFTSADRSGGALSAPAPLRIAPPEPLDLAAAALPRPAAVAEEMDTLLPEGTVQPRTEAAVAASPRPVRRPSAQIASTPAMTASEREEDATRRAILEALGGQQDVTLIDDGDDIALTNIAFTNAEPRPEAANGDFRIIRAVAAPGAVPAAVAAAPGALPPQTVHAAGQSELVCVPRGVVEKL
ncbi:hypothetical protein [Anianabacter salinae]|uniref:hypothetical protein n=1 Tax=Anianabacter salinae TaxID=2851023 RepID=UPI00225E13DC|nr:hypothetical protein [Anianabacter salinae]MBV0911895.1 hypothetical protein [Anianabacter salinae]